MWRIAVTMVLLAASWPSLALADETLNVTGGRLQLEWRGEFSAAQKEKLRTWLQSVSATVAKVHGTQPRPEIRIVLEKQRSNSAIPFARVLRGRRQGVLFYINPGFPLDDYITDWTAYHELSHLFIPYPGQRDIWFSEGLASYYQNVLQYRAGLLTEQQAWQKLYEGFERGRNDTRQPDMTLEELSRRLRELRAFMRVYWSGALYFLEADMQLRTATGMSLDDILQLFGTCCLMERRDWSGREIAQQFDRLAETRLFVPLFDEYAATLALPDYMPTLDKAGVTISNGQVEINPANTRRHSLGEGR